MCSSWLRNTVNTLNGKFIQLLSSDVCVRPPVRSWNYLDGIHLMRKVKYFFSSIAVAWLCFVPISRGTPSKLLCLAGEPLSCRRQLCLEVVKNLQEEIWKSIWWSEEISPPWLLVLAVAVARV